MSGLEGRMGGLEERMSKVEMGLTSTRRLVVTLATEVGNLGRLISDLCTEQSRLTLAHGELAERLEMRIAALERTQTSFAERLSGMLTAAAKARTEDVARLMDFEERLHQVET